MRKKLKKYNNGGFIPELLNTLNAVPGLDGSSLPGFGQLNVGAGSTSDGVLLNAMQSYAGKTVPSDLMGQYRRGSISSAMNGGLPGQFSFMNNFMQQNQLGQFAPQPQINTDPFQFMPQVGFSAQQEADMDAADRALQPTGPINTMGPQLGLPTNPNVNMQPAPIINPGTVTSSTYGMHAKPTSLTASPAPSYTVPNPKMDDGISSGMGGVDQTQSLLTSIAGETNEFDQVGAVLNKGKNVIGTLKKVVGEDVFKSHAAKLASKLPGKIGQKIGAKVAESAVQGAGTKFGSFLGSNAGAAASLGVGLLGKGIQELDKKDGNYSTAGAMGGGALQGAAMGSMLGPMGTVIGGALGAGVGALQKRKFEQNAKSEALAEKSLIAKDNARTRLQSKQILANVPTQGIKEQVFDEGGKTPAREYYIPEGDEITLDMINQYLTDTRSSADDPYDFSAAMDTIAYHESGMDPQRYQMDDGPGRGMVQYDEPSALAASNRLKQLAEIWGKPNPEWNTPEGTKDFSKLTVEQQKILWLADKLRDKTVDLAALGMREEPLVDFWADHHWRGEDKDRAKRQLSFESHRIPAKVLGLPEYKPEYKSEKNQDPVQQQITPTLDLPGMFHIMPPIEPSNLEADTVKMKFEDGGPYYEQGDPIGGFLSLSTRGGWPNAPKSYYPFSGRDLTVKDGVTTVEDRKGYVSGLKEMLDLGPFSVPTGRKYIDNNLKRSTTRYRGDEFIDAKSAMRSLHQDDLAKTFDQYKTVTVPGYRKSVQIQGEDLNWLQRQFPRLLLERYKTKNNYNKDGELVKKVTVSKAGGREVKKYPTSAELNAIIEQDIQSVQSKADGGATVTPEKAMSYKNPQFRQWEPSRLDLLREAFHKHNMKDDSTFENLVEFFDFTGISSWDDAYRASQSDTKGLDQSLDMVGAIPLVSKLGRGIKIARMGNRPVQMTDMAQHYYAPVKRVIDGVNRSDAVEDELDILNGYAYGGHTNDPDYIAEGGEVIQHAPGDIPKTDMNGGTKKISNTVRKITGDKHSAPSGGVGMSQEENAFIYSDQLRISKDLQKRIYDKNGKLRL